MSLEEANRRLGFADSQHRAAVLVHELQRTPSKPSARKMLREWFNLCDALAPYVDDLREQFKRVGYVTDDPKTKLTFPVTVYRGAWDDDEAERALSWTLDRSVAEKFCRMMTGLRWTLVFGISRPDHDPVVWQATCWDALGYFNDREEREVIPSVLTDVQPIARLVTVKEEV